VTTPLVDAREITVRVGDSPIFDNVDLTLLSGAELALTGRSGSGKTTLLLVLAGLLSPTSGTVRWPGLSADPIARRREIGLVFQAPSLLPELTAAENVTLPLRLRGDSRPSAEHAAQAALAAVDLTACARALPAELSGGQQQRVAVARVLAGHPRLVLADEPTGALDRKTGATVLTVLRDAVRRDGGSLIVATHDNDLAALLAVQAGLADRRLAVSLHDGVTP
jgi:ABC-type lipoprotein export system ATPase subunit